VLTRWTEHLDAIVEDLVTRGITAHVLKGGMSRKARRAVVDRLAQPGLVGTVLVATASFLGEGFDCPALDTVFLAFPIKFKGSIVQYVGRILRPTSNKARVSCTTTSTSSSGARADVSRACPRIHEPRLHCT